MCVCMYMIYMAVGHLVQHSQGHVWDNVGFFNKIDLSFSIKLYCIHVCGNELIETFSTSYQVFRGNDLQI